MEVMSSLFPFHQSEGLPPYMIAPYTHCTHFDLKMQGACSSKMLSAQPTFTQRQMQNELNWW
jgi:hypothetical protein